MPHTIRCETSTERKIFFFFRERYVITDAFGTPLQPYQIHSGTTLGFRVEHNLAWWEWLLGKPSFSLATVDVEELGKVVRVLFASASEDPWELYGELYEYLEHLYPKKRIEIQSWSTFLRNKVPRSLRQPAVLR